MQKLLLAAILLSGLFSCEKESNQKACWQGFHPSGYVVQGMAACDKTLDEMKATYPGHWFYRADEPTYCWQVQTQQGSRYYMRSIPASMVDSLRPYGGYSYSKVDCNSFCTWQYLDKTRSKITGLYSPTKLGVEVYAADSCSKLFLGRIITIRETTDTIVTREFSKLNP